MKLLILVLSFVLVALLSTPTKAQTDPTGLLAALRAGNAVQVRQIIKSKRIDPSIVKIAEAQLTYAVPRLLKLSQTCERDAIVDPKAVTEALYCNEVAVAATISLGDAHELLSEYLWRRVHLIPALEKDLHWAPNGNFSPLDQLSPDDFAKLVARTPPIAVHWSADSMIVPIDHAQALTQTAPRIRVSINGRTVDALLDTGLATSAPLVVVESGSGSGQTAADLGLTPLLGLSAPAADSMEPVTGSAIPQLWRIADTVKMGPLLLHHLFVPVMTSRAIPPGVYVTIALLRRFGSVVLGKDAVSFARDDGDNTCAAGVPMTFAGNKDLTGWLVFPATVAGRREPSALITGAPAALAGDSTAFPMSFREKHNNGVTAMVGTQSFHVLDVGIFSGDRPYHLEIGTPILATHTVTLAFGGAAPEICLAKNDAAATAPDRAPTKN